ncbi:hypothetical protein ACMD2_06311, partial [Ananas comosus]
FKSFIIIFYEIFIFNCSFLDYLFDR